MEATAKTFGETELSGTNTGRSSILGAVVKRVLLGKNTAVESHQNVAAIDPDIQIAEDDNKKKKTTHATLNTAVASSSSFMISSGQKARAFLKDNGGTLAIGFGTSVAMKFAIAAGVVTFPASFGAIGTAVAVSIVSKVAVEGYKHYFKKDAIKTVAKPQEKKTSLLKSFWGKMPWQLRDSVQLAGMKVAAIKAKAVNAIPEPAKQQLLVLRDIASKKWDNSGWLTKGIIKGTVCGLTAGLAGSLFFDLGAGTAHAMDNSTSITQASTLTENGITIPTQTDAILADDMSETDAAKIKEILVNNPDITQEALSAEMDREALLNNIRTELETMKSPIENVISNEATVGIMASSEEVLGTEQVLSGIDKEALLNNIRIELETMKSPIENVTSNEAIVVAATSPMVDPLADAMAEKASLPVEEPAMAAETAEQVVDQTAQAEELTQTTEEPVAAPEPEPVPEEIIAQTKIIHVPNNVAATFEGMSDEIYSELDKATRNQLKHAAAKYVEYTDLMEYAGPNDSTGYMSRYAIGKVAKANDELAYHLLQMGTEDSHALAVSTLEKTYGLTHEGLANVGDFENSLTVDQRVALLDHQNQMIDSKASQKALEKLSYLYSYGENKDIEKALEYALQMNDPQGTTKRLISSVAKSNPGLFAEVEEKVSAFKSIRGLTYNDFPQPEMPEDSRYATIPSAPKMASL